MKIAADSGAWPRSTSGRPGASGTSKKACSVGLLGSAETASVLRPELAQATARLATVEDLPSPLEGEVTSRHRMAPPSPWAARLALSVRYCSAAAEAGAAIDTSVSAEGGADHSSGGR